MTELKYSLNSLPGELSYRDFHYHVTNDQQNWRRYQDWRINDIGLAMNDIDSIVSDDHFGRNDLFDSTRNIECDSVRNYAILEMKHWRVSEREITRLQRTETANSRLARDAGYPFFVIRYFPPEQSSTEGTRQEWEFTIYPVNDRAKAIVTRPLQVSERRYVWFLHLLRGDRLDLASPELQRFSNERERTDSGALVWTPETFYQRP